jgi:hypothetical protein
MSFRIYRDRQEDDVTIQTLTVDELSFRTTTGTSNPIPQIYDTYDVSSFVEGVNFTPNVGYFTKTINLSSVPSGPFYVTIDTTINVAIVQSPVPINCGLTFYVENQNTDAKRVTTVQPPVALGGSESLPTNNNVFYDQNGSLFKDYTSTPSNSLAGIIYGTGNSTIGVADSFLLGYYFDGGATHLECKCYLVNIKLVGSSLQLLFHTTTATGGYTQTLFGNIRIIQY